MIVGLFSSRSGGTKAFMLDGVTFGWNSIAKMFERKCHCISCGLTIMVPRLRETHQKRCLYETKCYTSKSKGIIIYIYLVTI